MSAPIILINSKIADYDESLSIDFEFENPVFSDNHFNREYTFEFTLPLTANNKKITGHKNRLDVSLESKAFIEIRLSCGLMLSGIAFIRNSSENQISVYSVSEGIEFVKVIEQKDLKDVSFSEFHIYDQGDTLNDKLNKWQDHKFERNFIEDPKSGTHKFPMIFTAGYDGDYGYSNYLHQRNYHVVNPMAEGNFVGNWGVLNEDLSNENDKWWPFTIAPCPRVEYLFRTICSYFGIRRIEGDLLNDNEFLQAIVFAGIVLDKNEGYYTDGSDPSVVAAIHEAIDFLLEQVALGVPFELLQPSYNNLLAQLNANANVSVPYKINIHTEGFSINELLPNVKVASIFKLLNELFGAVFIVKSNILYIRKYDDYFKSKVIDVSSYVLDDLSGEIQPALNPKFFYEAQEENTKPTIYLPIWNYVIQNSTDFTIDESQNPIVVNPRSENEEFPIEHFPMKSTFFVTEGFEHDRAQYLDGTEQTRRGYGELMPRYIYPYAISSIDDDNKNLAERFFVGYYRGVYDTKRVYDDDGTTVIDTISTCWPYSHATTIWDSRNTSIPFGHSFGKSAYLNEYKGPWESFLKTYADLKNGNISRVKMNWPDHVVLKMNSFNKPWHLIKTRRGSIKGFLTKISGTITSDGLRDIEAEYRVPKSVLSTGDFNGDFSSDFD